MHLRPPGPSPARLRGAAGVLLALLLLGSCGSGSVFAPPKVPTNFGLLASTQVTVLPVTVSNPFVLAAQVTEDATTGGFSVNPGSLPSPAPPGPHAMEVRFAPIGAGTVSGSIALRYEAGGQVEIVTHEFQATGEAVLWQVSGTPIDFGQVEVGQTADRLVTFRNASTLSPVTFSGGVQSTVPGFSVVGTPFPITVDPGLQGALTLRFAPTQSGFHNGFVDIGVGDAGGPLRIPVTAGGTAPPADEIIVDFGTQTISGNNTPQLTVDVPADAISLTVEGYDAGGTHRLGLGELIGPGGKVYENTALTGAYIWSEGSEVFSTTLPNTDRTDVQLVPGGGQYTFRIRRMDSSSGQVQVRAIIERRAGGANTSGVLDLNVWLANGISATASGAATDTRLQAILARIDTILSGQGMTIGDVDYYDVGDPAYDDIQNDAEFSALLRTTSAAAEVRLNLFFVQTTFGGGVVGAAATISGPKRNGTSLSGVISIYEGGYTANTVGLIAAHEVCHFCGLYHTVEQFGSHDFIDDTANCPASGTNSTCTTVGGGYLMHWQAVGGTTITNGQGAVVRGHPTLRDAAGGSPKPRAGPLSLLDLAQVNALPSTWCRTCNCDHKGAPPAGR